MTLKSKVAAVRLLVAIAACLFGVSVRAAEKMPFEVVDEPVFGKWCRNFDLTLLAAMDRHVPMLVFCAKTTCTHCQRLEEAVAEGDFVEWQSRQRVLFDFGLNDYVAREFVNSIEKLKEFPLMCLWWNDPSGITHSRCFMGQKDTMPVTDPSGVLQKSLMASVDALLEDWGYDPESVPGGEFAVGNTIGDRMEAEIGYTTYVDVPLTRNPLSVRDVCTNVLTYSYAGVSKAIEVAWPRGAADRFVRIPVDQASAKAGDVIGLELADTSGWRYQSSAITYVERENSPKNPAWIGTRTADELQWGEWTMDLGVAKEKVAAFNAANPGKRAYTLALVAGGLWCPDCARNDAYVIDTPEFKAWARDNNVACVCIDIPSDPTVGGPCLLNREVREVSKKYIDADPEHGAYQSGTGYLSRWMISDGDAAVVMARNAALVGVNTLNGGWNRPERANQSRTGVPIFILLREDGTIAGRIETFASTSPDDATYIRGNIRRLNELLAMVEMPEEESNFHPSTTRQVLCAQGGTAEATLSGANQADTFRLTDTVGYAQVTVTATGETSAGLANTLSLYCTTGGVTRLVTSDTGRFSERGLSVTAEVGDPDGTYFARLEIAGLGDLSVFGQDADIASRGVLSARISSDAGTVGFASAEQTVNVADGEGEVVVVREGGRYGRASVRVFVKDAGSAAGCYDFPETNLVWEPGETGEKSVPFAVFRKDGALAAGSFGIGLEAAAGNLASVSEEMHRVTLEDSTDPSFESLDIDVGSYAKFETGAFFALRNVDTDKSVTVRKVDGALPSGLKLAYDRKTGGVVLSGSAKTPGAYSASYTVSQGGVTGEPTTFTFVVSDPSERNPFVSRTRSAQAVPLRAAFGTNEVVAGTLTVSVSAQNRISAKYQGTESRALTFGGSWRTLKADGTAVAELEKNGCVLTLEMDAQGALSARLSVTPDESWFAGDGEAELVGSAVWPQVDYATWAGYYTVTLVERGETDARLEPVGTGYLTLTVKASGKTSWKGVLADGTAVSGTSQLGDVSVDAEGDLVADLALFKRTGKAVFATALSIKANAERWADDTYAQMIHDTGIASAYTLHRERNVSYLTLQKTYGGWYVANISPELLCETFGYDPDEISLVFDTAALAPSDEHGALLPMPGALLVADSRRISIDEAGSLKRFSFVKKTGLFSGSATLFFADGKSVAGTLKGVLMPGWSGCGACVEGRTLVDRPFGSGTFYFKDKFDGVTVTRSLPVDMKVVSSATDL